jgi:hypothetical protein
MAQTLIKAATVAKRAREQGLSRTGPDGLLKQRPGNTTSRTGTMTAQGTIRR